LASGAPLAAAHSEHVMHRLKQALAFVLVSMIAVCLLASLFMGPVLLFPIIVFGLLALGVAQLLRRDEAVSAAMTAGAAGAQGTLTVWGKVVSAEGECPAGAMPRAGQRFGVTDGEIWPPLCSHVRGPVLAEVVRMERGEAPDEEPVHYHDADHTVEIALFRAPRELRAAA